MRDLNLHKESLSENWQENSTFKNWGKSQTYILLRKY